MTQAKAPAQKAVASEPATRADKFKVKNTSKSVLTLANGSIKPDGTGTMTNAEYSYLYKRVEIA